MPQITPVELTDEPWRTALPLAALVHVRDLHRLPPVTAQGGRPGRKTVRACPPWPPLLLLLASQSWMLVLDGLLAPERDTVRLREEGDTLGTAADPVCHNTISLLLLPGNAAADLGESTLWHGLIVAAGESAVEAIQLIGESFHDTVVERLTSCGTNGVRKVEGDADGKVERQAASEGICCWKLEYAADLSRLRSAHERRASRDKVEGTYVFHGRKDHREAVGAVEVDEAILLRSRATTAQQLILVDATASSGKCHLVDAGIRRRVSVLMRMVVWFEVVELPLMRKWMLKRRRRLRGSDRALFMTLAAA